jgi:CHAD domain-containing protein
MYPQTDRYGRLVSSPKHASPAAANAGHSIPAVRRAHAAMAKPKVPVLSPDQSYRSAMRSLIADRFAALWRAAPVALAGADPEGVHDVRVASRRLRAAMDVASGAFPADWFAPLHRTAKEITGALGGVRDRDVLLEHFAAARAHAADADTAAALDRLTSRIEREREAAREEMIAFFDDLEARRVEAESVRRFDARGDRTDAKAASTKRESS